MRMIFLLTAGLALLGAGTATADDAAIAQAIETAAESLRGDEVQFQNDFDVMGFPATVTVEGFAFCLPPDPTAPPSADPVPPANIYGCENDVVVDVLSQGEAASVTMAVPLLFVDCSTHVLADGTGYVTCTAQMDFEALVQEADGCTTLTLVPGSLDLTVSDLDGQFTDPFISLYWASVAPMLADQLNDQDAEFEVMVESILAGASELLCDVVAVGDRIPEGPAGAAVLHQNAPNPFNPRTIVAYTLESPGPVRLQVFDLQGRLVRVLDHGHRVAGRHEAVWNGNDGRGRPVPTGTYFCKLESGGIARTVKLTLLR
jgi:hypothetical protein